MEHKFILAVLHGIANPNTYIKKNIKYVAKNKAIAEDEIGITFLIYLTFFVKTLKKFSPNRNI
jgi:hypothetical protein